MTLESVRLNDVVVGGKPVEYNISTGTLSLAGDEIPLDGWLETRRRIDMIIKRTVTPAKWKELRGKLAWLGKRDRLPPELRDYEAPSQHQAASSFLTDNLDEINKLQHGKLRPAPWYLRWLYDAVVTKE